MDLKQFKTVEQLAAAIKTMDMVTSVPWTDHSDDANPVGWSAYETIKEIHYKKVGKLVYVQFSIRGTSDTTTASFTLPHTKESTSATLIFKPGRVRNNSTWLNGTAIGAVSGSTITFYTTEGFGAWIASNDKAVYGYVVYEAA